MKSPYSQRGARNRSTRRGSGVAGGGSAPFDKTWRYFAPSLALGALGTWSDTGTAPHVSAHFNVDDPDVAAGPSTLNTRHVVSAVGSEQYMQASFSDGPIAGTVTLSGAVQPGDRCIWGSAIEVDGDTYVSVDYVTAHTIAVPPGPYTGWVLNLNGIQTGIVAATLSQPFAFSVSIDADGAWSFSYSLDWGATQVVTGTTAPLGTVASTLYLLDLTTVLPDLFDVMRAGWLQASNFAQSDSARAALIAEFRLMFEPGHLTIDGVPWIGDTLTIANASGGPVQWKRDGVSIAGATLPGYLCVAADIGPAITVDDNGALTPAVQHSFVDSVSRWGSASDLAYYWDFRDAALGAFASFPCRVSGLGLTMAGTGVTVDTSVGGKRTLVFNGSGGLFTSANITRLHGANGMSRVFCPVDTFTGSLAVIDGTGAGTGSDSTFRSYVRFSGGAALFANIFCTSSSTAPEGPSGFTVNDDVNAAAVWNLGIDMKLIVGESDLFYKNGVKVAGATTGFNRNNDSYLRSLNGNLPLHIAQDTAGASRWTGKLCSALVYYRRALLNDERVHADLVMGYLCGISVAATMTTLQGLAFGFPGQSNGVGTDPDYTTGMPSPWPAADRVGILKKFDGTTLSNLVEPVNGLGGTYYIAFLDSISRAPGYSGFPLYVAIPEPPIAGTKASQHLPGTTNYKSLVERMWVAKKLGYKLGGVCDYQGESDAILLADKNAWTANKLATLAQLRTDLMEPDLRFSEMQINNIVPGGFPYWADMQALAVAFPAADPRGQSVCLTPNAYAEIGDGLHLKSTSLVQMGYDLAANHWLPKWPAA